MTYIYTGSEWNFRTIQDLYEAIEEIGVGEYGLDIYRNQFEIVTSEQMIDAYVSTGLPLTYNHWSYGKRFSQVMHNYKRGFSGLALEMVINSNPCINYLMEENSATMQAMVMAHAGMGHNTFFKNNYMYKDWTTPDFIVDYMLFAKNYISKLEISEGQKEVELFLDSCHALQNYGTNQYKHPSKLSLVKEKERIKEREEYIQSRVNEMYKILPKEKEKKETIPDLVDKPEENILYFCEKYSPNLKPWQRECIRIVRKISQYFYPQWHDKVINEGTASYFHYKIMHRLHEKKLINDAALIEFYENHSKVVHQPKGFVGINPYKLGIEIFNDVERICKNPTEEDKKYFPELIGENSLDVIKDIIVNYRDESFIKQFLSPKLVRDFKFMSILDDRHDKEFYYVKSIQDKNGYEDIKNKLARQHDAHYKIPKIEVIFADLKERDLFLLYTAVNGKTLLNPKEVLNHVKVLWGGNSVILVSNPVPSINDYIEAV